MQSGREDAARSFEVKDRLGRFTLVERLGAGGYGVVFRATYVERKDGVEREAAVKILRPDAHDAQAGERLKQEILALSRANHPNVVRFLDFDKERGAWWFAMEFVRGGTAHDLLKQSDPPSAPQLVRLLRDVLKGLAAIHKANLIHRDIKPANVLIRKSDGSAIVADLGIVSGDGLGGGLTETGMVVGSGCYTAPERIQPKFGPIDARSDLWSVGILAFELATRQSPFAIPEPSRASDAVCYQDPDLSALEDPVLGRFVRACLHKDPRNRPASAATALAILEDLPVPSPRPSRWLVGIVAVSVLAVLAWAAWPGTNSADRGIEGPSAAEPDLQGSRTADPADAGGRPAPLDSSSDREAGATVAIDGGSVPETPTSVADAARADDRTEPDVRVLEWAETLVALPDPKIVTSADLRGRIEATGLPWKVRGKESGIELVLVPPGEYLRGASPGDGMAQDDEKPRHRVKITQAFYLGVTEVTNAQYRRKVGGHDSKEYQGVGLNGDRQPAVYVSWTSAQAFCQAFDGLRLPTEGEWEYAARACGEVATRYPWGDDVSGGRGYGNLLGPRSKQKFGFSWDSFPFDDAYDATGPVAQFRANALGLHDMTGNVWEWCSGWYGSDEYGRYGARAAEDPKGPANGEWRALRGGSWDDLPAYARLSFRFYDPINTDYVVGFRVARTP